MHRVPVEEDSSEDTYMPDIVAATKPVKEPWVESLGNLHGIDDGTGNINRNLFET